MSEKKERIVFDVAYQPQVKTNRDTQRIMLDVIIALMPAAVWAVYQFGINALVLMLVSCASAVFFEWGYRKLLKKEQTIDDLSAVVTGLMLSMTLPPSTPWWVPVIGVFFAIVVVKQLYGGIGKNFLNPALAGRAFLMASYASIMGTYSVPRALKGTVDAVTMATPLSYMYGEAAMPKYYSLKAIFLGTTAGALGEVSALLLILGGLYLVYRKVIRWRIPLSFLGTVAILSLVFGYGTLDRGGWMLYNLFTGGIILNGFFMATDYTTSPVTFKGQILYGFGIGAITMLIRYFGGFPEGVSYAILIMNLCTWAIDKGFHRHQFGVTKEDIAAEKAAKKAAKKEAV
ncbi:MAG: RnfABCDGE type electron transport complex subunit D [Oscillospiraceae bacterium]|nr:RnfABCDGE type electron transport complex subunit D [Oscillospiraceae bacterium]